VTPSLLSTAVLAVVIGNAWQTAPPLPVPRTEVAAAVSGKEILVAGGYLADGSTTARVDLYDPATMTWRDGPGLPLPLNHASAATLRGAAVVVGGYGAAGPTTTALQFAGDGWRTLPPLPFVRAAAGAAALKGRLYVFGGIGPYGLARSMLVYDPDTRRWSTLPGPTPRQHLAAAAAGGRIYALAGRAAGYDTNVGTVESWAPGERRWRREPDVPEPRGGTGAAAVRGQIVSAGAEAPAGTSAAVYAFDVASRRWVRLPDLPTARHGLGVVGLGGKAYVIGGGPEPGLTVTGANEVLGTS
jgi:non-specific serine/threonine protein kinase